MPVGDFLPVAKPQHQRGSKTAKERGHVSNEVYNMAMHYAGGRCLRCGWHPYDFDLSGVKTRLEAAHYIRRHHFGQDGVQPYDILMLCGPQVNTGTCHHWIDSTADGKAWAIEKREEVKRHMLHLQEPGEARRPATITIEKQSGLFHISEVE